LNIDDSVRWPILYRHHPFESNTLAGSPTIFIVDELQSLRNNNKRQSAMFKRSKVRQAGLIVFATTLLLILPNLNRLFG
jgi:hypothetical protein